MAEIYSQYYDWKAKKVMSMETCSWRLGMEDDYTLFWWNIKENKKGTQTPKDVLPLGKPEVINGG